MTRMLSVQETFFGHLSGFLTNVLPDLPTAKPQVWSAFLSVSELDPADARVAIRTGSDPFIFVEDVFGVDGFFDPSKPQTVHLALSVIRDFEKNQSPDLLHRVEATVLHEMVHWAWARAGRQEPEEMGKKFEQEAYQAAGVVEHAVPADAGHEELGSLSRRFESNGKPGSIGRDTNGGWSYGLYQLSSAQGTLGHFLDFLAGRGSYRAIADALRSAGGDAAARVGAPGFCDAWKQAAEAPEFARAQQQFIRVTHYDPFVSRLSSKGIELGPPRSKAVREVAWSVSVQHGPGATVIFERPWKALSPAARQDDALLINAVYQERSRVDVYFRRSSEAERAAVLHRFDLERADALAMLRAA